MNEKGAACLLQFSWQSAYKAADMLPQHTNQNNNLTPPGNFLPICLQVARQPFSR